MSAQLATLVFFGGILGLFYLYRDREAQTSPWLWLPVVWLSIGGSRNLSGWFGQNVASAETYLEGSPFDRNILSVLILISIGVLISRAQRTSEFLSSNPPLVIFFGYCLASVLWSDYPFVTFKHWTKVLGNFTMVLIVLTDPDAKAAMKRFIARVAFILIPASVLIIRYYPQIGRYYDKWEGKQFYSGVTEDKNMLGAICLVLGLGILWQFVNTLLEKAPYRMRRLMALGTVLAMDLWLLHTCDSATSFGCFALGGGAIVGLGILRKPRPMLVHTMVATITTAGILVYVFKDAFTFLVESLGRNTTLTGRTDLWADLLQMDTHPILGAGFESFFLGERLEFLWIKHWWHPTEAHNGYLDTYLTLGIVGLFLIAMLMLTGYRNIVNVYRNDPGPGSYRLAILLIIPIYNITEAAFKVMNPVWIMFLLSVTAVPALQAQVAQKKDPAKARDPERRPTFQGLDRPERIAWGPQPAPPRSVAGQPALQGRKVPPLAGRFSNR